MSYTRFYESGWQSGETGGTPIVPAALDHMETGILNAHAPVDGGYGVTMIYLNGESSNFLTLLQQIFAKMPDRSTKQITFSDSSLGSSIRWWGTLWRYGESYGLLVARSTHGIHIQRTLSAGAWQAWEYENPPIDVGTEYRTTERWMGKPVYVQLMDLGEPVNGIAGTNVRVFGVGSLVRASAVCGGALDPDSLSPYVTYENDTISVQLKGSEDLTGRRVYVTVYYTR